MTLWTLFYELKLCGIMGGRGKIDIIGGDSSRETVTQSELIPLLEAWVEEQFQPAQSPRGIFDAVRTRIRKILPSLDPHKPEELERRRSRKDYLEGILRDGLSRGDTFVARLGGKAVGMVTLIPLPVDENRSSVCPGEVVEFGKAFVLPDYRKQGVYRSLRNEAIKGASSKYPHATLVTATKEPTVSKMAEQDGWTEFPYAEYCRIHGLADEIIAEQAEMVKRGNFKAYYFRPNG